MLVSKIHTNSIQNYKINYSKPAANPQVKTKYTELPGGIDAKNFVNIKFCGKEELLEAVNDKYAKYNLLMKELDKGTDINTVDNKWGYTPLMWVVGCHATKNKYKCIEELLSRSDIDVNVQNDEEGVTALIRAVWLDGLEDLSEKDKNDIQKTVELLLTHPDIDVNIKDNKGMTALDWAEKNTLWEVYRMIENYVPSVDRRKKVTPEATTEKNPETTPKTYTTPDFARMELELASTDYRMKNMGFDDLIRYIDSDGFNPNYKDDCGRNVIHLSMVSKDERIKTIISKALAKGVDINAVDCAGQTALMKAIKNLVIARNDDEKFADLAVIKFILDQNPDIEIQDQNKQTAFHLICMTTSVALLDLILSKNPKILLKDVTGKRGVDYFKTDEMRKLYHTYVL